MARPTNAEARADEIRAARRKKPGPVEQAGLKLTVDETRLDRNNYHYRFVKDDPNRIRQLGARDYDIAPESAKEDSNSLGTMTSALGGVNEEGRPYNMVLMRKHSVLHEDDLKEKQKPLDEIDEAIRRGQTGLPGQELKGSGVYTPGQNSIERVTR
jgi:hypothetical protein